AAELAVARGVAERPAHRVDDAVERLRDAPHLLHAEGPDLRVLALEAEALDRRAREVPLRPLREHGDARDDVGAGLEVPERVAFAIAALVGGPDSANAPVGDEQLLRRRLRQDRHAERLGLVREEPAEPRERGDVVPAIP